MLEIILRETFLQQCVGAFSGGLGGALQEFAHLGWELNREGSGGTRFLRSLVCGPMGRLMGLLSFWFPGICVCPERGQVAPHHSVGLDPFFQFKTRVEQTFKIHGDGWDLARCLGGMPGLPECGSVISAGYFLPPCANRSVSRFCGCRWPDGSMSGTPVPLFNSACAPGNKT